MGFSQALSGLQAASQNLDVVGNDIANASTVGYKDVRAEFADVYATSVWGSTGAGAVGIGTQVAAVQTEFTQGNITTTGNPLDIAINGTGFFREVNNGVVSYSRDGEFSVNANGFIVSNSGTELTGYPASATGQITTAPPVPLQLSTATVPPQASSTASLSLNLPSSSTPVNVAAPGYAFSATNPATYTDSTSITAYDSLGNSHQLSYYFVNTGPNAAGDSVWRVYTTVDGANVTTTSGGASPATLTFGPSGTLLSGSSAALTTAWNPTDGASAMSITTTLPVTGTTQYGSGFTVSANSQNGYGVGQLSSFTIGPDGTITGSYTNGQTLAMGQIVLASFTDPQALAPGSNNLFSQTFASGPPTVGAPGTGTLGVLQSGALESSTVDITSALVNMITAQRAYQANAETVKTQDQVEQTLMNLR